MAQITSVTLTARGCPEPLRAFTAPVERTVKKIPTEVGAITGWTARGIGGYARRFGPFSPQRHPWDFLAAVATETLALKERIPEFIEDALLIDASSLTTEVTARKSLPKLLEELIRLLQWDGGCYVVTDLQDLAEDADCAAVESALEGAGFTTNEDRELWELIVVPIVDDEDASGSSAELGGDEWKTAVVTIEAEADYTRNDLFAAYEEKVGEPPFDEEDALFELLEITDLTMGVEGVNVSKATYSAELGRSLED